jgi:hypothetical protein
MQSLPVGVELDAQSSIRRVCIDADVQLPWSARRQLARSNETMRTLPAGPSCLANAHLDLTPALIQISSETARTRDTAALGSCLALRDSVCTVQDAPVCGVFPDGTRRSYRNACAACESRSVQGWLDGPCPLSPKP